MKGIVLHKIKYKDTRDIVYLYTDLRGRKTFIFNRTGKTGHLYPLSLIDFETNERQNAELQYIKEFSFSPVLPEIFSDPRKSAIAMFVGEFLYKILKEEGLNTSLFQFIHNSIHMLDIMNEGFSNFHLHFMVQLSKYLGFSIPANANNCDYFDIKLCKFVFIKPLHPQFFDKEDAKILSDLLELQTDKLSNLQLSGKQRISFANSMINFYSFRFDYNLIMKSLGVLHEVFS